MYTPPPNRWDDESELRALVADAGAGWFLTSRPDAAPAATYLPLVWHDDVVVAHLARANPHWRELADDSPALVVVTGPDAYVTPSWYAAKAATGKVVPTWNYSAVHLTGTVRLHHDPTWLRAAVSELTDVHEQPRPEPWRVDDAPDAFIEAQLRGIVGLEIHVTEVEGKAKLSQNRSAEDRERVATGLAQSSRPPSAAVGRRMGG